MISSKRTTIASDTKANCQPDAAMVAGWGFAIAESMRNLGPLTLRDRLLPQRVIAKHQRGHCFYHRDSARKHTWIMPPTRGQFCFLPDEVMVSCSRAIVAVGLKATRK